MIFRPNHSYTVFDLKPIQSVVSSFLSFENDNNNNSNNNTIKRSKGKLQQLVETTIGHENWHLAKKCFGCEFLPVCMAQVQIRLLLLLLLLLSVSLLLLLLY